MRRYSVLVADNDGTTLDSEMGHYLAISATTKAHHGGEISYSEWWKHCSGKGHSAIYEWLAKRSQDFSSRVSREDFIVECLTRFGDLIDAGKVPAKPGIIPAFDIAKSAGLKIAINSNTWHETVERALATAGVLSYVDLIVCVDDADKLHIPRKPAPYTWIYAASEATKSDAPIERGGATRGVRMSETILLEDSESGLESARRSGGIVIQTADQPSFNHLAPRSRHAHLYSTTGEQHVALIKKMVTRCTVGTAPS